MIAAAAEVLVQPQSLLLQANAENYFKECS
jgi:hypothetical protein